MLGLGGLEQPVMYRSAHPGGLIPPTELQRASARDTVGTWLPHRVKSTVTRNSGARETAVHLQNKKG